MLQNDLSIKVQLCGEIEQVQWRIVNDAALSGLGLR